LLSEKMVSEIRKQSLSLSYRYSRGRRRKFTLKDVQSLIEDIQKTQKRPINFTAFLDFKYPRAKATTPLPIKLTPPDQTELELCGIRFRSSGPLQSLIIDTFPKKIVHVNVVIGVSHKLSLDLINEVLKRGKKIISQFLEVR